VIRDPEAIERIASSDLLVIEHSIALERTQLELDTIEAFPGITEEDLLRFADAAFHELDDERSAVLRNLCQHRKITPLRVQPIEYAPDVTLYCGNDCIKVGDLGSRSKDTLRPNNLDHSGRAEAEPAVSLMVGINGRVAGLIHFQRSSRPEATSTFKRLQSKRNVRIGLISNQSHKSLAPLAMSLGVDFHQGDLNTDDRIGLLKDCRQRGIKVAYISDRHVDPCIAAEAHIVISIVEGGTHSLDNDPAPVCLLRPQFFNLGQLWDIAHIHQRRLKVAHGYAILPNLLCVAGAFTWGFTSLASVVVTNLGTGALYLRMATSTRALEGQISRSLHPRRLSRESR
jgi:cation transport ATPase